jgi:predicted metalloprotease
MGGMGVGGILLVVVSMLMGKNPADVLSQVAGPDNGQTQSNAVPADDQSAQFVGSVLGSTEDVWGKVFQASGSAYPAPHLVLFSGAVASACGRASAAIGPFYCPNDQQVYLDTSFFAEVRWFRTGFGRGSPDKCDTFSAAAFKQRIHTVFTR